MKRQTKHLLASLILGLSFVAIVGVVWYLSLPAKQAQNEKGSVRESAPPIVEEPAKEVEAKEEEPKSAPAISPEPVPEPTTTAEPIEPGIPSLGILAWNVELDGGSDANVIAKQLAEFNQPIIALSEVKPSTVERLSDAHPTYESILGSNGYNIRLLFLIDTDKFEIVESFELGDYEGHQMNNGTHRSPLVVRLRATGSTDTFLVVNNHLARGRANLRQSQARALREWARDQTEPIICVGDFNMDYSFISETGNRSFNEMMRDDVWKWVKPKEWIDTNWADRNNDGVDDYPDSMLDFVFVANGFKDNAVTCEVIVRDGDFPDNNKTSDHRPVMVHVSTAEIIPTLRPRINPSSSKAIRIPSKNQ